MDAPPVQYVRTRDRYNVAYAVSGHGDPLVAIPQVFSHIEVYWSQDTFVLPWLRGLSENFRLHQYDGRGQGMSTRGLPARVTVDDFVLDLESLFDRLRLDRPVILGMHWMSHVAIRFAAAHPERVRALVISACPIDNAAWPWSIYETLADTDWETFLRSQAALGQAQDIPASLQRLRQTVTRTDWLRTVRAFARSDLTPVLPHLKTPTLVTHPRDFFNLSSDESSRLAASIPDSRFVLTDGQSPPGDTKQNLDAIRAFLAEVDSSPEPGPPAPARAVLRPQLTARQHDVLRLIAAGQTTPEIARHLVLSPRTVERHIADIYARLEVTNRAQAAVYAKEHGLI